MLRQGYAMPDGTQDEEERANLENSFAQPTDADLMNRGEGQHQKFGHMNQREKESLEKELRQQQERQQRYYGGAEKNQKSLAPAPHGNPVYDNRSRTREQMNEGDDIGGGGQR